MFSIPLENGNNFKANYFMKNIRKIPKTIIRLSFLDPTSRDLEREKNEISLFSTEIMSYK